MFDHTYQSLTSTTLSRINNLSRKWIIETELLKIQDLKVEFNTDDEINQVINGISFDIKDGETVGLVGESGSGKSVTSMSIMGLIPNPPGKITNGDILFQGKSLVGLTNKEYALQGP